MLNWCCRHSVVPGFGTDTVDRMQYGSGNDCEAETAMVDSALLQLCTGTVLVAFALCQVRVVGVGRVWVCGPRIGVAGSQSVEKC